MTNMLGKLAYPAVRCLVYWVVPPRIPVATSDSSGFLVRGTLDRTAFPSNKVV